MPQRHLANANSMPKKRRRGAKPLLLDSLYPGYLPASSLSPKPSGRLGSNPYAWNAFRGHARYACRRTPRQTSGLPAGAEPSFESKEIIASTNPKCPDTFENDRMTIPETRNTKRDRRNTRASRRRRPTDRRRRHRGSRWSRSETPSAPTNGRQSSGIRCSNSSPSPCP